MLAIFGLIELVYISSWLPIFKRRREFKNTYSQEVTGTCIALEKMSESPLTAAEDRDTILQEEAEEEAGEVTVEIPGTSLSVMTKKDEGIHDYGVPVSPVYLAEIDGKTYELHGRTFTYPPTAKVDETHQIMINPAEKDKYVSIEEYKKKMRSVIWLIIPEVIIIAVVITIIVLPD